MTETTVRLSSDQISIILTALAEKMVETRSYLSSFPPAEPTETDTCCPTHQSIYEEKQRTSAALQQRMDLLHQTDSLLELAGRKKQQPQNQDSAAKLLSEYKAAVQKYEAESADLGMATDASHDEYLDTMLDMVHDFAAALEARMEH